MTERQFFIFGTSDKTLHFAYSTAHDLPIRVWGTTYVAVQLLSHALPTLSFGIIYVCEGYLCVAIQNGTNNLRHRESQHKMIQHICVLDDKNQ